MKNIGRNKKVIKEEDVYRIGFVLRTHGTQGEVSVSFTDDVWDRTETPYIILSVDGIFVPFFMESYRFRNDTTALVKFTDYDSSEQAQELCGCEVYFPLALAQAPDQEDYTWKYFTGFKVIDRHHGLLGTVDEVEDSTQNVLFEVGGRYIPVAEELIEEVNHEERTLTMNLPVGLLEL